VPTTQITSNAAPIVAPVPEPSTLLLAAVGLAAVWRGRRRVELVSSKTGGAVPNQFEINSK
jgi:hypothetical protein